MKRINITISFILSFGAGIIVGALSLATWLQMDSVESLPGVEIAASQTHEVEFEFEVEQEQKPRQARRTPLEPNRAAVSPQQGATPRAIRNDPETSTAPESQPGLMPRGNTQAECRLRAYVQERDGRASAHENLSWTLSFGAQVLHGYTMADERGLIEIALKGVLQENHSGHLEIVKGQPSFGLEEKAPCAEFIRVALPRELPQGVYDLGNLEFKAHPLLLSGRIQDSWGRGLGKVRIDIVMDFGGRAFPQRITIWSESGMNAGAFELRFENKPQRMRFECFKSDYEVLRGTWLPGSTSLTPILEATQRG